MPPRSRRRRAAAAAGTISPQQAEALWTQWRTRGELPDAQPRFTITHVLYYLGGMVAIGAVGLLIDVALRRGDLELWELVNARNEGETQHPNDMLHPFRISATTGRPTWDWDGNETAPTFSPVRAKPPAGVIPVARSIIGFWLPVMRKSGRSA